MSKNSFSFNEMIEIHQRLSDGEAIESIAGSFGSKVEDVEYCYGIFDREYLSKQVEQ